MKTYFAHNSIGSTYSHGYTELNVDNKRQCPQFINKHIWLRNQYRLLVMQTYYN